jgi:MoxR-like ATPase
MKRKTVRLTESELTRLIKTIVEDTKEKMDMDFEMPDRGGFDVMSAVRKASKMFEREFAEELSDREMMKLERLADKIDVERVMSKLERSQGEDLDDREEKASDKIEDIIKQVSESYLTEGKFDSIRRID